MFVTTIEVKDRPTRGTRAFTDAEEAEIYRLVTVEKIPPVEVAAYLKVSFNTVRNVVSRQKSASTAVGGCGGG